MRAITVQQPWAWAVAVGAKDIENRSRTLGPYRGQVAIHAGAAWSDRGANDHRIYGLAIQRRQSDDDALALLSLVGQRSLPTGAVIAVGELVAVHKPHELRPGAGCSCSTWADMEYGGITVGAHLRFKDVVRLAEPVPAKGRLGLWTPPADVEAAVEAELDRSRAVAG